MFVYEAKTPFSMEQSQGHSESRALPKVRTYIQCRTLSQLSLIPRSVCFYFPSRHLVSISISDAKAETTQLTFPIMINISLFALFLYKHECINVKTVIELTADNGILQLFHLFSSDDSIAKAVDLFLDS